MLKNKLTQTSRRTKMKLYLEIMSLTCERRACPQRYFMHNDFAMEAKKVADLV